MSSDQPPDFQKLIPDLARWNDGQGIGVDAWLSAQGNFQLAIAFGRLFWPAFVEHDGCVLFNGFSPENYQGFLKQCDGDRARVESVMNHRHLLDLFCHAEEDATAEQLVHLGTVLQDTWRTKLARDFPGRVFEVTFDQAEDGDLLDYVVTFWQPANAAAR